MMQPSLPPTGTAHCAELTVVLFVFRFFCLVFACKKLHENRYLKKLSFFRNFGDFLPFRRRFSSILNAKTGPRRVIFRWVFRTAVLDRFVTFFFGKAREREK